MIVDFLDFSTKQKKYISIDSVFFNWASFVKKALIIN